MMDPETGETRRTDLMTLPEAQRYLGIRSRKTLLKYIQTGQLTAFKLGGTRWRILRDDMKAFLEEQRGRGARLRGA